MPSNSQMTKEQSMQMAYFVALKNEKNVLTIWELEVSQMHLAYEKKTNRSYIVYGFIFIIFW